MRMLIVTFCSLFSIIGLAQTKLISYKSHSGTNENFKNAIESNLFDLSDSNLGVAPMRQVKNAQLDTVIYVSKGKSIMVTSEFCKYEERYESNSEDKSLGRLWKKGKDTVFNHPLFSKKHSLDSIKNVLKEDYHFKNNIDNVVFIGYDNTIQKQKNKSKKQKKSIVPIITNFPSKPILLALLVLFSSFVAYFSWRLNNVKTSVSN